MIKFNSENTVRLLLIIFIFFMCIYTGLVCAQSNYNNTLDTPKVYFIGENQNEYDNLINLHSDLLLEACNNSMDKAYDHWITMVHDLEVYSEKNGFDIKGVKIWANVFWDANGKIKCFTFYPKPNSKNIDYDRLKEIVYSFILQYNHVFPTHSKPYSHYGTGNFPIFARLVEEK